MIKILESTRSFLKELPRKFFQKTLTQPAEVAVGATSGGPQKSFLLVIPAQAEIQWRCKRLSGKAASVCSIAKTKN
jgi:hypothetical protein